MHTFLFIVHAIGAPKTTALFKLNQANPEGQEINPEAEVQQAEHEEPEEEVECPNHEPASFMKACLESLLEYVISLMHYV